MANNRKALMKRSTVVETTGAPKIPKIEQLDYGEIAINYAKDVETISLKNNKDEIVTFSNEVKIGDIAPDDGYHTEKIFIEEGTNPGVDVYTKAQVDELLATINQRLDALEGKK